MRAIVAFTIVVLSLALHSEERARGEARSLRLDRGQGVDDEILQLYSSLRELPLEEQRDQMWALSSNTKAALWKYNIERYLQDHPELTIEGQAALREGVRLITTPAWFDIQQDSLGYEIKQLALNELKGHVISALSPEAVFEVFIRLGPEPEPSPSQQPRAFEPEVNGDQCHCASDYECWFWNSGGWHCYDSYCMPASHCGFLGNDPCTGRCKWGG